MWLRDKYPDKYHKMKSIDRSRIAKIQTTTIATISNGIDSYNIASLSEFCRVNKELNFNNQNLYKLLNGQLKTYKGFRLVGRVVERHTQGA